MIDDITPLVITFNEAPNIGRTLEHLRWARRVIVLDSGSTDATAEIVARFPMAEFATHPFESFAAQCNFGLTLVDTPWCLSLDADYVVGEALVEEMRRLADMPGVDGYRTAFRYCIHGRPLRGSLYPPRTVLHRVRGARYENRGHGHGVVVQGEVRSLRGAIDHDDRKPLSAWFAAQQRYARAEAAHILVAPSGTLSRADRIRRNAVVAPLLVFFYVLFAKGCILDGRAGWLYALQRVLAEILLAIELTDRRLAASSQRE
ncbi:MAG: glycosyltransferase family 2 protein [Bauldia sp.]|nr:glycosyltransferase family 2 protein [Bauldia sp.]